MADDVSAEIRSLLARYARKRGTRDTQFTRERPTKWRPSEVTDPKTNEPFTQDSSWELVVDLLEKNHELKMVILRKPKDKKGYVMKVCLKEGDPHVYIKLQLGANLVIGRSFHYDTEEDDEA